MKNHKIGIQNFRVFTDYHEFEIRPLTFLVGPNNSGKSSLVRSFNLFQSSNEEFSIADSFGISLNKKEFFSQELISNLGSNFTYSFKDLQGTSNKPISLDFEFELIDDCKLKIEIVYNEYCRQFLSIFYNGKTMFKFENNDTTPQSSRDYERNGFTSVEIDLVSFLDLYKKWLIHLKSMNISQIKFFQSNIDTFTRDKDFLSDYYLEEFQKRLRLHEYQLSEIETELSDFSSDLFDLEPENNFDVLDENEKNEFNDFVKNIMQEFNFRQFLEENGAFDKYELDTNTVKKPNGVAINYLSFATSIYLRHFTYNVELKSAFKFGHKSVEKKQIGINLISFAAKLQNIIHSNLQETTQFEHIKPFKNHISKYINLNEKPSGIFMEGLQRLVLLGNLNSKWDNPGLNYTERWLKKFGIGKSLKIKYLSPDLIEVYLINNSGKEINIFDTGTGVMQVISLIMVPFKYKSKEEIDDVVKYLEDEMEIYFPTDKFNVFLEEPESNLHPKWQSTLVELFTEQSKLFGAQFLVETHSEYMIRKLQYLRANKSISKEDLCIYYFNSDEAVSDEEPKVKLIEIDQYGGLSDNFGPGFYDEATNIKFEILKLNKHQEN